MADTERLTLPYIPAKNWWALRHRLGLSVPSQVSLTFLESIVGGVAMAKKLQGQIRALGLIDDANRLTDLGHDIRHNENYADACQRILNTTYPLEMREAFPPPNTNREALTTWIMRTERVGRVAAIQKAGFYCLLAAGDPSMQTSAAVPAVKNGAEPRRQRRRAVEPPNEPAPLPVIQPLKAQPASHEAMPQLHIDVQVHIGADASLEQIDHVFASMAKHLYGKP